MLGSDEYKKYYTNYKAGTYTTATSWIAIGNSSKYFKGTFDGQGKTIKNLYINATIANQGLFGYSNGGNFKNITLEGTNITSTNQCVGAVLGDGIVTTISNCKNEGTLSTTKYNIGGIVGRLNNSSTIINCENRGTVTGTGYTSTTYYFGCVGGIVGNTTYIGATNIENCKNYSTVYGKYRYIGGICGKATSNNGRINNCINVLIYFLCRIR
mgnify:CR=1 FL=1